jgi:hypothetical protein
MFHVGGAVSARPGHVVFFLYPSPASIFCKSSCAGDESEGPSLADSTPLTIEGKGCISGRYMTGSGIGQHIFFFFALSPCGDASLLYDFACSHRYFELYFVIYRLHKLFQQEYHWDIIKGIVSRDFVVCFWYHSIALKFLHLLSLFICFLNFVFVSNFSILASWRSELILLVELGY